MIWKCLKEISELVEKEGFVKDTDSIGYDLPDNNHHLFIYVDNSRSVPTIVIEPNRIVDLFGTHEPCGDSGECNTDDVAGFLSEVAWVIETQCM